MQGLFIIALQVAIRTGWQFLSPRVSSVSHLVIKGYLVDWDAQKAIWDGIFSDQVLNVSIHAPSNLSSSLAYPPGKIDTAETSLLITEPYFNLPNVQEVYDQFVFEEYEFQSYFCSTRVSTYHWCRQGHVNLYLVMQPQL